MKKVLFIRFSSIGDIVLTTPVIRCIKQQLNAEVHYITKSSFRSILDSNPYVDKVHSIDEEITEVLDDLQKEQYDFVVDLHHNLRSLRLKKKLNRPSAAFPKLNPKKWLYTNFKWNLMPDVHVVDRYFEAANELGVKSDSKGLDYFIPVDKEVDLNTHNIPSDFIAFSIGAKFATKRLPNDKIIEIIQQIEKPVVLLGGKDDLDNSKEIEEQTKAHNLVGKLDLDESASVLKQSAKVVTHDTGLMHIASAFEKKIISIWGNTTPDLGMYPYLPGKEELSVKHEVDMKCRPCSKIGYQKCPKAHFKCMKKQDAAAIAASINA